MTKEAAESQVVDRRRASLSRRALLLLTTAFIVGCVVCSVVVNPEDTVADNPPTNTQAIPAAAPGTADWPQWGGDSARNNVPAGSGIPTDWDVGTFDRKTGEWNHDGSENVKWIARVGSQTYGNPVVADGQVYVGTNNGAGYLKRYPAVVDLGCLVAFAEEDGRFLWQHSSEKLPTGRVHDWPLQGICCAPLVEGERLWFVSSRGEVICADTQGFYDGEDDGPVQGGLARLFAEPPTLDSGLSEGTLSNPLKSLLASRGVDMSGRVRVKDGEREGTYELTLRSREGSEKFSVVVDNDRVVVYTDGEQTLIDEPVALIDGLAKGTVSPALTALLEARGFPVAGVDQVDAQAGEVWKMQANVDGSPRELTLRVEGDNLSAYKALTIDDKQEADTIWVYDMMAELGVSQHNMCSCSVTAFGDILFVNTSNGVDESHINIPNAQAASFMAMDKNTGELLWSDASPGENILHGQWSSPAVVEVDGEMQAIFTGGDGWVYSFAADRGEAGKPTLLWKFDANPKTSEWVMGGRGTRNNIIGTPVMYKGLIYIAVGQDPEHGEGVGHLWCLDPTKRGDISAQLAVHASDPTKPLPPRRLQAVDEEEGEIAIDNPNSGVVWEYQQSDQNGDGEFDFEETMHRTCGTVAIKDDLLFVADFSGLFHCLDATSGEVYWTHDMMSAAWGSPLIVDGKVYVGDEDGELSVFKLTSEKHEPLAEVDMRNSVYSTPIIANNVMFISNKTHLFAISPNP
ncbi:MAG: PQQ-binding-like beta-propeller repeat protein [Planctomycetota bacterium]